MTGGAGYLGAHVVREFLAADLPVTVLDDLSTGELGFIPGKVSFTRGTILDGSLLERIFDEHDVTGVVHLAAFGYAGVSVQRPLHAYEQNVDGTTVLLAAMQDRGVSKIVFSSSAAVYGAPEAPSVSEGAPKAPQSPYGESKLIGEWLLRDQEVAAGLRHTSLRCFNVIGSGDPAVRDRSPHNLLPAAFDALLGGGVPVIHGDDHPTPDGTPVRDWLPAPDVARAFVAAARRLDAGEPVESAYNLGGGTAVTVAELLAVVARVTGIPFTPEVGPRRAGDPARIVADGALAARDLSWRVTADLDETVASAWAARTAAVTS